MEFRPKLNKNYILKNYDQIQIFAKYLNISEGQIKDCIEYNDLIHSPLRANDPKPSAGFRYSNKNKLKLKDFGGYFWGDCFDLVAYIRGYNIKNGHHFMLILEDIIKTMPAPGNVSYEALDRVKKQKHVFEFSIRDFERCDVEFWKPIIHSANVSKFLTEKYVFPIQFYWIDRHLQAFPKYEHKSRLPAYAYHLGYDSNQIANCIFYSPNAIYPEPKFKTNVNSYQGMLLLPDTWDVLIITKSYKDVISMLSFIDNIETNLKIAVVALPSETYKMTSQQYNYFASKTRLEVSNGVKAIFSILDEDYAGVSASGFMKREYDITRFMFRDFPKKDFTDNVRHCGKDAMLNVVSDFINYLEQIL